MEYELTVTLGPASDAPQIWVTLRDCGASGFRLNTSHLGVGELEDRLAALRPFLTGNRPAYLVLDLQGSKWRLGSYEALTLREGSRVRLECATESERPGVLPVPHDDFFRAAAESPGVALLNDAKTRLRIEAAEPNAVAATVERGGRLEGRKGLSLPGTQFRTEGLKQKDREIVALAREFERASALNSGVLRFALSYVRDGIEMAAYRDAIGEGAHLIAKLERGEALADLEAVEGICDELWLCRGDLGAELGLVEMARAAAGYARALPQRRRPSALAGQVLEHMSAHPTPTRAEVCALHDALSAGYAGVVLSDETAVGPHAVEACRAAAMFRAGEA